MADKISQYRIPGFWVWALILSMVLSAVHGRYLYQQACSFSLQVSMSSSAHGRTQFYYDTGDGLTERESVKTTVEGDGEFHTFNLPLPLVTIKGLRFDPLQTRGVVSIQEISFVNGFGKSISWIDLHTLRPRNQIKTFDFMDNVLKVTIEEGATDPQIVIPLRSPLQLHELILFPFASRLFGWFVVFFVSTFVLIWILRKQGLLAHFLDHPVKCIRKSKTNAVVVLLLAVILCLNVFGMRHLSITYDEEWHWKYGQNILKLDPRRPVPLLTSTMPFSALNAISGKIGLLFGQRSASADPSAIFQESLLWARLVTVFFSLLLAIYVFRWSKELYGPAGGLLSLFLYAFSPNIIAHSHLITADLYVTCMITIAIYYFWKFMTLQNFKNAFLSAVTLGLAQLSKYTAAYLYPIFMMTILLACIPDIFSRERSANWRMVGNGLKSFVKYSAVFLLISLILINAGWFGYRSFTPLKNYEFQSHLFQQIQQTGLKHWPIPIPYPFLQGLDMVKDLDVKGTTHENVYLLGELHTRKDNKIEGFTGYFFYALFFKEPIAIQVMILCAFLFYMINRKKFSFFKNELFLVVPLVFFLVYFNFFFRTHIGIRYILAILPLLYILTGCLFSDSQRLGLKSKCGIAMLCLYLVASVLSYYPHFLSYFNECVWDRTKAYKVLADSNLDWGQSEFYLQQYKINHPDAIVYPKEPVSGKIVVSVNELVGLFDPEKYRWLRNNFEPSGHIAYSYLVYDITPDALDKIQEKSILKKENLDRNL